jgi:hypothetical protein
MKMENQNQLYLIAITSLETGDVELQANVYSSFAEASNNIEQIYQEYMEDAKYLPLTKHYEDVDPNNPNKISDLFLNDKTFLDGYTVVKGPNSVLIYKKETEKGYLYNGSTVRKITRIGIVSFNPKTPSSMLVEDKITNTKYIKPSNLEHGRHVSFIEELKLKQRQRAERILTQPIVVLERPTYISEFSLALLESRRKLRPVWSN